MLACSHFSTSPSRVSSRHSSKGEISSCSSLRYRSELVLQETVRNHQGAAAVGGRHLYEPLPVLSSQHHSFVEVGTSPLASVVGHGHPVAENR